MSLQKHAYAIYKDLFSAVKIEIFLIFLYIYMYIYTFCSDIYCGYLSIRFKRVPAIYMYVLDKKIGNLFTSVSPIFTI